MCKTRIEDAYRLTPLYEQMVDKGQKDGLLGDTPTDEEVEAVLDHYRAESKLIGFPKKFIGNDLTDDQLDDLWRMIAEGNRDTDMADWWEDKPHQIMYRLLLRLTRAEAALDELGVPDDELEG